MNMFEMSETTADLFASFALAQGEFENVTKDAENPFFSTNGRKAKYATLDDVLEMARPILSKNGLALIQSPISLPREGGFDDYLITTLTHKSGQYIRSTSLIHCVIDQKTGRVTPQARGSAISYARRYDAMSILGIAGADDDDGNVASGNNDDRNGGQRKSAPPAQSSNSASGKTEGQSGVKPIGDTIAAINKAQEPALKKAEEHLSNPDNGLSDAQKKVIRTAIDKRRKALAAPADKAAA